uniref:nuclear transport factor 2 family protein n=1 Tax=Roseivirga sp. TaxID=1964215 RepID=UPI004047DE5C
MKSILILFALSIFTMQTKSPEQIVQQQLDAYNQRDISKFMDTMGKNVVLYNFADGQVLAEGFDAVKSTYALLFAKSPELHSKLINRIVLGNQVIDHESITGRMGNTETIELAVIYEIKEGKIVKISVLRK